MLSASGFSALRFVGELFQFSALLLAGLLLVALIARVLGPPPKDGQPPESVSDYETALATRLLHRYGWRWALLCLTLAVVGKLLV